LGWFKLFGQVDVNAFVQFGSDDDGAGRGNYFGEAEEADRRQDMNQDRTQRHCGEVLRSQRLPGWKEIQLGHSFRGNVYGRHGFDNVRTLSAWEKLLMSAEAGAHQRIIGFLLPVPRALRF
jgi:hypothetical protein